MNSEKKRLTIFTPTYNNREKLLRRCHIIMTAVVYLLGLLWYLLGAIKKRANHT